MSTKPFIPAESEIIFIVEESDEGGYSACAIGESIFTQAETLAELRQAVQDAVHCHYDENNRPQLIRLHMGPEKTIVPV